MAARPKAATALETEWLREYARTYMPTESAFSFSASELRRAGVTLIGIRNAFREGVVTFADKLDGPGAIWMVEGEDEDGNILIVELEVVTETLGVTLRKVTKLVSLREENGNDAA